MTASLNSITFDWLLASDDDALILSPQGGATGWHAFPIPPELGHGGAYALEPAVGMTLARGEHHVTPLAVGKLIPLAQVSVEYSEQTFVVECLRGGHFLQRSIYPPGEFLAGPGLDLFRMTDRVEMTPIIDGSHDVVGISLAVGWATLCQLIGSAVAEELQSNLGLMDWPQTVVKPIPLHVSAHLHSALPTSLVGSIRKLHCQARVLDYFDELTAHLSKAAHSAKREKLSGSRARQVHEFLMTTNGRLPTLDELAGQFACPAKRLNADFLAEYGQSIYTFISNYRLDEAHVAIQKTEVPMKKLAERLGYAHFNHFSSAFKRKFGYPPGSLRRK